MLKTAEIHLRKVSSVRNAATYWLIETKILGHTVKVAEIYMEDVAKLFADALQKELGIDLRDTTGDS